MPSKICDKCNAINGVRAKKCKHCHNKFVVKKSIRLKVGKRVKDFDWTTLVRGDMIYLAQGNGPYCIINNEKHYYNYHGAFTVWDVLSDGIVTYSNSFSFIYMGEARTIDKNGWVFYLEPHKIQRVKLKNG